MGFRFRKSVSLGPVRVNFSKSGIGYSVGVKGARVTKKANGGTRTTLSVPGTGISYTTDSKKGKRKTMNNNTNKSRMKEVSYAATSPDGYDVSNIFNKFDLSDKEMLLLSFISQHYEQFNNEFSIHDISALGHISTTTYYNNLYDKALLLKPVRGKYALNTALINQLANEEIERQKRVAEIEKQKQAAEIERQKALEKAKLEKKEAERKALAWICRILFIPMILLSLMIAIVQPLIGILGIGIGIIEFIYQKNYFTNLKNKERV